MQLGPRTKAAALLILPLAAGAAIIGVALVLAPPPKITLPPQRSGWAIGSHPVASADHRAVKQARPEDAIFGPGNALIDTKGGPRVAYGDGRIFQNGAGIIYVAAGRALGAAHPDPGYLGVWYLDHDDHGFRVRAAYPRLVATGTFGSAPDWKLTKRFARPHPVIEAIGFGMWFGDTYEWCSLVELGPNEPRVLFDNLIISRNFTSDQTAQERPYHLEAQIGYDRTRDVFVLTYSGVNPGKTELVATSQGYVPRPGQPLHGESESD